jgi:hypothetical protein
MEYERSGELDRDPIRRFEPHGDSPVLTAEAVVARVEAAHRAHSGVRGVRARRCDLFLGAVAERNAARGTAAA